MGAFATDSDKPRRHGPGEDSRGPREGARAGRRSRGAPPRGRGPARAEAPGATRDEAAPPNRLPRGGGRRGPRRRPRPGPPGAPVRRAHCSPWERTTTTSLTGNARKRPLNNIQDWENLPHRLQASPEELRTNHRSSRDALVQRNSSGPSIRSASSDLRLFVLWGVPSRVRILGGECPCIALTMGTRPGDGGRACRHQGSSSTGCTPWAWRSVEVLTVRCLTEHPAGGVRPAILHHPLSHPPYLRRFRCAPRARCAFRVPSYSAKDRKSVV